MPPTPLEIKTKALQRLLKEHQLYEKEVLEQEEYLKQMKASDSDEYEIRKQEKVLDESKRMVPELAKKIKQHGEALKLFLGGYSGEEDLDIPRELLQKCSL